MTNDSSIAFDIDAMRRRLRESLEKSGRSMRSVSLGAKLAHGYMNSILNEGKEPTVQNLAKICREMDVSLAWIMLGIHASPRAVKLISYMEQHPDRVDSILALLGDG